jgi:hypothetical protein
LYRILPNKQEVDPFLYEAAKNYEVFSNIQTENKKPIAVDDVFKAYPMISSHADPFWPGDTFNYSFFVSFKYVKSISLFQLVNPAARRKKRRRKKQSCPSKMKRKRRKRKKRRRRKRNTKRQREKIPTVMMRTGGKSLRFRQLKMEPNGIGVHPNSGEVARKTNRTGTGLVKDGMDATSPETTEIGGIDPEVSGTRERGGIDPGIGGHGAAPGIGGREAAPEIE